MARPKKASKKERVLVATTLTPEDRRRLDEVVTKKDIPISVFVRGLIKEACAKEATDG